MSTNKISCILVLILLFYLSKTQNKISQSFQQTLSPSSSHSDEENNKDNSSDIAHEEKKEEPQPQEQQEKEHEGEEHGQSQHQGGQHTNVPGVGLSILFIFGGLLYGALLKLFSRITLIPYNPLLLFSGIILGMEYKNLGLIGQATELIIGVHPNGILAIFLPTLVFESAFKTEWHTFKKLAGQSLVIGILSSILGASLIMLTVKFILDVHNVYSWHEALLFGSLLTCTDIFSFVTKLKRSGTPQKLTSLIEGESLFNYCTCVLIFQFVEYFMGEGTEQQFVWDYVQLFFLETLGGITFGVVFGFISVYCIKRMIYDGVLVVTLIVIFCYAIYLIAEFSVLRASGIISLTVYGLYLNAFGKTWLFGQAEQYVISFWSYLVFVAETSIFLISGVMVGGTILNLQVTKFNHREEYTIVIYIYFIALASRFLSIATFFNYLKRLGEGLNWKEVIVLTFAGLKGAIGISLAMMVFQNQHYSQVASSLILFHVTANSLMTLVINGLSTGLIIQALGVSSLKKVQYKFFQEYLYSFEASIIERKDKLKEQKSTPAYEMIDWHEVDKQTGIESYREMITQAQNKIVENRFTDESKFKKSQIYKLESVLKEYSNETHLQFQGQEHIKFDLQVQFRKRFLKDLIAKYWEYHQSNFTSPAALMLLIQSANSDLDKETQEIESWNWIKNQITFNMRFFSELMKLTVINQLAKSHLFQYVSFCYDVVSSYIKANEQVREEYLQFYHKSTEEKHQEEQKSILLNILRESEQNQKEAEFFLINYLEPSFPEIEKEVKTRKVSFYILHSFKKIIDKNYQNGQLEPNQYEMLNQIIDKKSLELNLQSPKWEESNFLNILKESDLFKNLPDPVLQLLSDQLGEEHTFDANERIIDNSEIAKYLYFVKKGGCMVEFTNDNLVYKESMLAGQVFGFEGIVTNIYHSKATANTMAQIIQVKKSCIIKIFETFPNIELEFWKSHIFQCYKMFVKKDDITFKIGHLQKEEVMEMVSGFKLQRIEVGEIEETEKDMIFIRGNVEVVSSLESENKSKVVSKERESKYDIKSEAATPFHFISKLEDCVVKIKEPSYFLVGEIDYDMFDRMSMRMSRGGRSWKIQRKPTT